MIRVASAFLVVAALTWAGAARAGPPRVAVVDAASDPAVAMRLRAELSAAGFSIVDVDTWTAGASNDDVSKLLQPEEVVGALRVEDDRTEVWVVDPRSRNATLRDVVHPTPPEDVNAVRTVEIIRAELRSNVAKRTRSYVDGDWGPTTANDARERHPIGFDVGIGFSASPGGVPVLPTFTAGASWMPSDHVGLAAVIVASPFHANIEAEEGATSVWSGLVGAGLLGELTEPAAPWGVRIEGGLAVSWLILEGEAVPPYESASDTLVVALPYVRPSLRWRLTPNVALRLDALVGVTFPRPVIAFAGREVATWGRPLFVGSFGVELSP